MRRISALATSAGLAALAFTVLPAAPAAAHSYSYSIETRGGVGSDLGTVASIAQSTLDDGRGWALGGAISFAPVASGGDLRLVLATPAAVAAASPGCSASWSCRVGPLVLINEERWNTGTASWTGSLQDYRQYVINHEVGHWLGLGHVGCAAPGTPAPVMQQQSISLDGCEHNIWPLPEEKQAVARQQVISSFTDGTRAPDQTRDDGLLVRGDRGPAVAYWQRQLNLVRTSDIAVDGIFGPLTERATMDFERSAGIGADGVVGPQTRAALQEALR